MQRGRVLLPLAFVGPTLAFLVAFNIFPLLYNIVLGFTDASLIRTRADYVGGGNYNRVFTDPAFARAIQTTALFVVAAVTTELVLGFVLALALWTKFKARTAVVTVLLVPMMLPPAVMGLYGNFLFNGAYGVVNQLLATLGLPQPQWLTDNDLKLVTILLIDIWMWTPFMMLIASAGLNAIPPSILEAAKIDRAGGLTVFWRIVLPMCTPLLLLAVLLRTTDAIKQFDLVMAITGPNDAATQTLSALLYQTLLRNSNVGLGSAYAVVCLVMVIALATVLTRQLRPEGS